MNPILIVQGSKTQSSSAAESQRGTMLFTDAQANQGQASYIADTNAPFSYPYYWAPVILKGSWL